MNYAAALKSFTPNATGLSSSVEKAIANGNDPLGILARALREYKSLTEMIARVEHMFANQTAPCAFPIKPELVLENIENAKRVLGLMHCAIMRGTMHSGLVHRAYDQEIFLLIRDCYEYLDTAELHLNVCYD